MRYGSVGLGLMLLFTASGCLAQSQDQSQDKNNGTAATNTAKPTAPADSTPANPPAEKKKQKKVWTNDEIGSVGGTVSVVGESTASSSTGSSSSGLNKKKTEPDANAPADDARQRLIDNYRLFVHPLVLGTGKRLLRETSRPLPMRLVDCASTSTGILMLNYEAATGISGSNKPSQMK